jgi:hypothetical protein
MGLESFLRVATNVDNAFPEFPNIRECFDHFATMRAHGKEYPDAQRKFYAAVEGASLKDLEELDKAAHIGGEDVISQSLAFIRQKVQDYKDNRERHLRERAKKLKRRALKPT